MASLRSLLNLSLAAKCRLLFGSAVLLIIAAGLVVPFYHSQTLIQERSLDAARLSAAHHLAYQVHEVYFSPDAALGLSSREDFVPRPLTLFERGDSQRLELTSFHRAQSPSMQLAPGAPERVQRAFKRFLEDPGLSELSAIGSTGDFEHITAIRASQNCLRCHQLDAANLPQRGRAPGELNFMAGELVGVSHTVLPAADAAEQRLWSTVFFVAAGVLASLLALLVFYWITEKFILDPVHELTKVAEQASQGNLNVRSTVSTGDDYEKLANAFNTMLAHLQIGQQELAAANRSLNVRLDELAEANVGLYEANQIKTSFLANVTHELRTPLNSIIGFADLLLSDRCCEDPKIRRYSEHIRTSGLRLLEQINDLLDLAKIEAGRMELNIDPTNLLGLIQDMIDFMRPQVLKRSQELDLIAPDRMGLVDTDAAKVRQVLYNLLSNAIKFTPEGGKITLHVVDRGEAGVHIAVADTGPGVDPRYEHAIFEKFRQADTGMTRQHTGTGLGLAISRELAGMLGGRITLDNRPGLGSTFTLELPRHPPQVQ